MPKAIVYGFTGVSKMKPSLVPLAALAFLFASTSFACSFDTECSVGSRCIKTNGNIYGACVGGMSPGNRNDQQPVYAPLDPNRTYGNTCSFDTECGPGSVCAKSNGNIQGVCLKR